MRPYQKKERFFSFKIFNSNILGVRKNIFGRWRGCLLICMLPSGYTKGTCVVYTVQLSFGGGKIVKTFSQTQGNCEYFWHPGKKRSLDYNHGKKIKSRNFRKVCFSYCYDESLWLVLLMDHLQGL